MSLVSPASSRPRAASAWIGPLASCSALGRPGRPARPPAPARRPRSARSGRCTRRRRRGRRWPARSGSRCPGPRSRWPPARSRPPPAACSASQLRPPRPGPGTSASTSNPSAGLGAVAGAPAATPADPVRAASRRAGRAAPGTAGCRRAGGSAPGPRARGARSPRRRPRSGTSRASSVSWRLRSTSARCSRSLSPALPLTSSTRSTSSASEPNSVTHLAAVFSPTPGMLGRLSLGSPRRAAKSGYWAGVRPYFSVDRLRREPGHVADAAPGHQHRHVRR